jgi:hypothetical protein
MPRMAAIGLLLFLVSYIFAVMYTQLFKDLYEEDVTEEDYFGRLDKSTYQIINLPLNPVFCALLNLFYHHSAFFTLFQIMTLDGWAEICREVMEKYSWAWLPFVVFVIVTGFVVVNLIIAVICDAISALHDDDKAKLHGTFEEDANAMNDSTHPAAQEDVRQQLEQLENHVMELTRMQETTLQTLSLLTQQLQRSRVATAAAAASVDVQSKKRLRRTSAFALANAAAENAMKRNPSIAPSRQPMPMPVDASTDDDSHLSPST